MDASRGHEACRTAFPKDCDRTRPATRREVIVTQPDAKSSFFALVPKVLNSSLETLERYMTRHGIAGRLEWSKEALAGWRRCGSVHPSSTKSAKRQFRNPLKDTWPGSLESLEGWTGRGRWGKGWPQPTWAGSLEGWSGKESLAGSRTKSAKRQFRGPLNIHDQVAWKAGVRQGGPAGRGTKSAKWQLRNPWKIYD